MRKILSMLLVGAILLVFSPRVLVSNRAGELRAVGDLPMVGQKPSHQAGWWFPVPKHSPPVIPPPKHPAPVISPSRDPASVIPPPAHPAPMVPPLAEVIYIWQAAGAERPSAGVLSN